MKFYAFFKGRLVSGNIAMEHIILPCLVLNPRFVAHVLITKHNTVISNGFLRLGKTFSNFSTTVRDIYIYICILRPRGHLNNIFLAQRMGSDLTKTNWPFVEKNSKHCCGLASSMLGQKLQTYSPIWWAMMVMFIPWYFLLEKHHQKTHPNGWCMQIPEF